MLALEGDQPSLCAIVPLEVVVNCGKGKTLQGAAVHHSDMMQCKTCGSDDMVKSPVRPQVVLVSIPLKFE